MSADVALAGVHWIALHPEHICDECGAEIRWDELMAAWFEVASAWPYPSRRIKRHYCEECGHLLEDSLTTTETL